MFSFRQTQNSVLSLAIKVTVGISIRSQFLCLLNVLGTHIWDVKKDCCTFIFLQICTNFRTGALTRHPSAFFFPQWDLVCDRKSLSKMTATIFFLGVMLGAIAFGYLSDKYAVSIVMEQLT